MKKTWQKMLENVLLYMTNENGETSEKESDIRKNTWTKVAESIEIVIGRLRLQ